MTNPTLPPYTIFNSQPDNLSANNPRGYCAAGHGIFNSVETSGWARGLSGSVTGSTTHSIAGGTPLTTEINIIKTCANAGDAVTLPALKPGQEVEIYNRGTAAAGIFPAGDGVAIDGGSTGAPVTLSAGNAAVFTCIEPGTIISAQFGAASA